MRAPPLLNMGRLMRVGVQPQELEKLNKVPLLVSFVGLIVNITLLAAMSNFAWLKATALSNGQPFTAYVSLGSVQFGSAPLGSVRFGSARLGLARFGSARLSSPRLGSAWPARYSQVGNFDVLQ